MGEFTLAQFDGLDLTASRVNNKPTALRDAKNVDLTADRTLRARDGLVAVVELHPQSVGLFAASGRLHALVPAGSRGYKTMEPPAVSYDPVGDSTVTDFPDRTFGSLGELLTGMKQLTDWSTFETDSLNQAVPYVAVQMANGSIYHHYLDYGVIAPNARVVSKVNLGFTPGPGLVKIKEKFYTPDHNFGYVRYCAAARPKIWLGAPGDAGFIPVGRHAGGARVPTAVSFHNDLLVVMFDSSTQFWFVSPDETQNRLIQAINGPGTLAYQTLTNATGDVFYYGANGFRSLVTATTEQEIREGDIGTFVEPLTRLEVDTAPRALWSAARAQYLCAFNRVDGTSRVFAYKFLRTRKVMGWTYWDLPVRVDYWAELDETLYIRSGDMVYRFSADYATDQDGEQSVPFAVETQRFGDKSVGASKRWDFIDVLQSGTARFDALLDVGNSVGTRIATIAGSTLDKGWVPVALRSQTLGLRITGTQAWELEQIQIRFRAGARGVR